MESFLLFSLSLKNSGTKAAEKAPSAVILLKIFGNLKAIIKTSATKTYTNNPTQKYIPNKPEYTT